MGICVKVVFSERCLEYGRNHIENPLRVIRIIESLRSAGFEFVNPDPAPEDLLKEVHAKEYLKALAEGREWDPETPTYPGIYEIAMIVGTVTMSPKSVAIGATRLSGSKPFLKAVNANQVVAGTMNAAEKTAEAIAVKTVVTGSMPASAPTAQATRAVRAPTQKLMLTSIVNNAVNSSRINSLARPRCSSVPSLDP